MFRAWWDACAGGMGGTRGSGARGRDNDRDRDSSGDRTDSRRTERFRPVWPTYSADIPLKKFFTLVEEVFSFTNFSDREKIFQFRSLVSNKIRTFMENASQLDPALKADYPYFKAYFIENIDGINPSKKFVIYNTIKQAPNESVIEYSVRLKDVFFDAFPEYPPNIIDDTLSRKFIETLHHNEIAMKLKDHNRDQYGNFTNLVKAALVYETNLLELKGLPTNFYASQPTPGGTVPDLTESYAFLKPQLRSLSMDEAIDHICQILGQTRPINPNHKPRAPTSSPGRPFSRPFSSFRGRSNPSRPFLRPGFPNSQRPPFSPSNSRGRGRFGTRRPGFNRPFNRPSFRGQYPGLNPANKPPTTIRGAPIPSRPRGRGSRRPLRSRAAYNPPNPSNARPIARANKRVSFPSNPLPIPPPNPLKRPHESQEYTSSDAPNKNPRTLYAHSDYHDYFEHDFQHGENTDSIDYTNYYFDDTEYYEPDETDYDLEFVGETENEYIFSDGAQYLVYPREDFDYEEVEADDEDEGDEDITDPDRQTDLSDTSLTNDFRLLNLDHSATSGTEKS